MRGKTLHVPSSAGIHAPLPGIRMFVLALFALCGACAGPLAQIESPVPIYPPPPIATPHGAVSGQDAQRVLASAVGAPGGRLVEHVHASMAGATFVAGNRVEMLNDGPSTFKAYAEAIARATHHVHVETFIFADDRLGRSVAGLLAEKRRAGVEVRVIYDGIGSMASDSSVFDDLRAAGADVREFRPLTSVGALTSGEINNRDHRKLLIVDGRVAFVGGINVSGTYNSGSGLRRRTATALDDGWRDSQARIEGPAAAQFQALFFASLARTDGTPVTASPVYFPRNPEVGSALVAAVASANGDDTAGAIHAVYLNAITHARTRLWFTQAYFAPDRSLREALVAAAARGVDTRILLPGFSDSPLTLQASRAVYDELLAGGVRLFEHDAAFVHAKTALIDDHVAVVGSANLDFRSLVHNNEVAAIIVDADFARGMAATFEEDLRASSEVTPADRAARRWSQRLWEKVASLFWYWI